jgi:hypothetical protein
MSFYHFHQNNSGGSFHYDYERGISCNVIVEADSVDDANERGKRLGMYFDGVESGRDCSCCGDRWYPLWNYGKEEAGAATPEHYGEPAALVEGYGWSDVEDWEGFIHFKSGLKVGYAHGNGTVGLEFIESPKEISSIRAIEASIEL